MLMDYLQKKKMKSLRLMDDEPKQQFGHISGFQGTKALLNHKNRTPEPESGETQIQEQ